VNCPHCARPVANDLARCPYCGSPFRALRHSGSSLLRPQSDLPDSYAETPLVGHDHPLRRLRAAWRNAHIGYGQLVSLVGENGAGRSRLIRELGATIDEEAPQALWLVGQAHSHTTYVSFQLLVDLLAPWVGDGPEQDATARLGAALERLAEDAPTTERWSLLALAREARDPANRGVLPTKPLIEALGRALWRVTDGAPLVIILEDLEWADAASLTVLDALLPKLTSGPALIIATHHADWSHDWPDIARHAQLFLGPLAHGESARLIAAIAADRDLAPATVEALAFAAGGNPLLIEQATLAVLEREGGDGLVPVPATLTDAIQARRAALSPTAREVLLAAAAIGPRFVYRAVAMVTEATLPDRWAIDAALRELTRRRLIIRWHGGPEVAYRFVHGLVHDVAYGALATADRAALEARVADWLLSESALRGRAVARIVEEFDQRALQTPADEDRVLGSAPKGAAPRPAPTALDLRRRGDVLARIVLADLSADQRASLAFCLQHGYSYAEAGELLGIGGAEVREHLYNARKLFKRLYEASALTPTEGRAGITR
jgi:adenylate cyclase